MTKLRDGWNAKNDIGMVLENIARNEFNPGVPYGANNTIYHSDKIIASTFVEVMICILRKRFGYEVNQNIEDFIMSSKDVFGKRVVKNKEESQRLLNEFREILNDSK